MQKIILIFFLLCESSLTFCQVTFQKTYQPNSTDDYVFYHVTQTLDNGYVYAGSTFSNTLEDYFIMRTNSMGDTLWTRTFGGPDYDVGTSVAQTPDSGFFIGGFTWGFGIQDIDFYLVRTNKYGDTLWTRTIGSPSGYLDYCHKVIVTSDNNLAAFGSQSGFNGDFYLNKWDNNGNLLWSKAYFGSTYDFGFDMQQTSDNGFIMTGFTFASASSDTALLVIKADSAGNFQWAKTYGGNSVDLGNSIHETSDGGYIIAGTTTSFPNNYKKLYLLKTNATGDTTWTRTYNINPFNYYWSRREMTLDVTTDHGYVLCSGTYQNGRDLVVLKTDSSGNINWYKRYGTSQKEAGYSICSTNDGGFLATGISDNINSILVIKADANGNSGCNEYTDTITMGYTNTTVTSVTRTVISNGLVKYPPTVVRSGGFVSTLCASAVINKADENNLFEIFPNPAENKLTIKQNYFENYNTEIILFNFLGSTVLSRRLFNDSEINLDIAALTPGLYLIELRNSMGSVTKRFIKK